MATKENTSTTRTTEEIRAINEGTKTFHHGLFKISDGINLQEKLEQASLFLDTAYEGLDEMVSHGEPNERLIWGYVHLIEAAKALVDSASNEVTRGGAA